MMSDVDEMFADEMSDAEVAAQIERTDAFIAKLRTAIAETIVDPTSLCAHAQREGLRRIASSLDAVDYTTMSNLANINEALRGALLELITVRLMCVGAGPTLDFADATAFLAAFQPMIDMALRRRRQ